MAQINRSMFRMYDLRGIAGSDITPEIAEHIGRAWGTYLARQGVMKAVLGQDSRASSPDYAAGVAKGLQSVGISVIDIGMVTSPMEYFAEHHLGVDGGVMVTASHNPPEFNGFKLNIHKSSAFGDVLQEVADMIEKEDYLTAETAGTYEAQDISEAYFAMLKEKIQLARPLKVVVDCGNGTAGPFAPRAFREWGCEVTELYCDVDPAFPNHPPDPVKEDNLKDLVAKVQEVGADIGMGFDGDGDRLGVVDRHGRMIWGDHMMVLFFKEVLAKNPGMRCIIEVKCSQGLVDMVEKFGGKPEFYKTGHSLIKARMKETGVKFTGEMSGHLFFADEFYGHDDAIYAAGRLLRILAAQEKEIGELLVDIPPYVSTPEVRVETTDAVKFELVDRIVKYFKEETDYEVVDVDGARVLFGDGWGLIRASNTQPVVVARAEAHTQERLEEIKKVLEEQLLKEPSITHVDWSGREG